MLGSASGACPSADTEICKKIKADTSSYVKQKRWHRPPLLRRLGILWKIVIWRFRRHLPPCVYNTLRICRKSEDYENNTCGNNKDSSHYSAQKYLDSYYHENYTSEYRSLPREHCPHPLSYGAARDAYEISHCTYNKRR